MAPDFKTIADFRRDNRSAFRQVFREFVVLCRELDLFGPELIAVDGTRVKAVNSRERTFTKAKLSRAMADRREVHPFDGAVTGPKPNNLVQVIAHGVDRAVDNRHVFMPGFRSAMRDAQIAAVANYVRTSFGGVISDLGAEQVNAVLSGKSEASWLIVNAKWLTIVGIILAVVVFVLTIWVILRLIMRKKRVLTR